MASKIPSRIIPLKNDSFFSPGPEEREKGAYIPPWTEPYIIGVAGNSGSGKTSVSQRIIQELNQPWTVILSFDNFYKDLSPEEREKAFKNQYDFDEPASFDLDYLVETVKSLRAGKKTQIPVYSFKNHARTKKVTTIYGANVIIIEGIMALYDSRLTDLMDLKVYVDTDLDVCLARRLTRDTLYRGRDPSGVMNQWEEFVKPNAVRYVNPTMNQADIIIPRGLENTKAIDLMIQHVQKQLGKKSVLHLQRLTELGIKQELNLKQHPNVRLIPNNNHTLGINSILFDVGTERTDFIFYFERISILIIEAALDDLTAYEPKEVTTATNYKFNGIKHVGKVVAVNMIRLGDCFMTAIKKTFPEISIGKLLIQSDSLTGEPQLHTESLPKDLYKISNGRVLLCDAQVISGAAAIMAIQVLIDHQVPQENIILCTYLCTELGMRRILRVFPGISMVIGKLSELDMGETPKEYNPEGFKDIHRPFRKRWIDKVYFGT